MAIFPAMVCVPLPDSNAMGTYDPDRNRNRVEDRSHRAPGIPSDVYVFGALPAC